MPGVVRVINPNSNPAVTDAMSVALDPLRVAGGPGIDCITLADGPFGIESDADVAVAAGLVASRIADDDGADAFVIACYSDPGLSEGREATDRPVLGIAECAALSAVTRAARFGVISIADASIPRHRAHLEARGLAGLCAGDRALNVSVAETASGDGILARMITVGEALRDEDGAGCVILGCAGMAAHRRPLEAALGIPVIDPVQAATVMAVGAVQLGS